MKAKSLFVLLAACLALSVQAQEFDDQSSSSGVELDVQMHWLGGVSPISPISGQWGAEIGFGLVSPKKINAFGAAIGYTNGLAKHMTSHNLPIYVYDRLYFSSKDTSPFIDLALGGMVNLKTKMDEDYGGLSSKGGGHMLLRTGLGLSIATNSDLKVHLKVGYQLLYNKTAGHSVYFAIGFGTR